MVNADLHAIESLMDAETLRRGTCGVTDGAPPIPDHSSNRTQQQAPPPQQDNAPHPRGNPPDYPPIKGVRWNIVQDLFTGHKQCGLCFSKDPLHWETGCPCVATIGKILVEDDKTAKEILAKYAIHIADHEKK